MRSSPSPASLAVDVCIKPMLPKSFVNCGVCGQTTVAGHRTSTAAPAHALGPLKASLITLTTKIMDAPEKDPPNPMSLGEVLNLRKERQPAAPGLPP